MNRFTFNHRSLDQIRQLQSLIWKHRSDIQTASSGLTMLWNPIPR